MCFACMCVCICTTFVPDAHGGQKRVMGLLKLEIQFLEPDPLSEQHTCLTV